MLSDTDPALACTGITVRFGEFQALSDVSLTAARNQVTALIGPNGAGKTTLLNVLSGRQAPSAGEARMNGRDITRVAAHRLTRLGLSRSFQLINVFPDMPVADNLRLALQRHAFKIAPFWRPVQSYPNLREDTDRALEDFGLTDVARRLAGELSHGEQRALELSLTVVGDPSLLLLDEPLAGVGYSELPRFVDLVKRISRNRTVLLIEHNMDFVMDIAREVVVLVRGSVIASGAPAAVRESEEVRAAYLGDPA